MVDLDDPFSKPNMAYLQISISSPIIYSSHASPVYFRSQKAPDNVMILFSLRFRHNLIPPPPFFFHRVLTLARECQLSGFYLISGLVTCLGFLYYLPTYLIPYCIFERFHLLVLNCQIKLHVHCYVDYQWIIEKDCYVQEYWR